jgi:hypothetical protein
MIDKKISIGSIITMITIAVTVVYTHGANVTKMDTIESEQSKTIKRVKVNEDSIVDLKIGVAKIESKLDDRFDRLEEFIMDLD